MHKSHPAPGGQPSRPEGNRPAQNARVTTPGTVGAAPFLGDGALDFLGLGDELGSPLDGPAPATPSPVDPRPATQLGAEAPWEDAQGELEAVELADGPASEPRYDEAYDETYDESYESQDETYAEDHDETSGETYDEDYDEATGEAELDEEGVHAAWREEEEPARGRSKFLALAAGVSVIGMLAVAGIKLVSATQGAKDVLPEPLAAHQNPLPRAETVVTPEAPGQGAAEPTRVVLDAGGGATPTTVRSTFEAPPPDPVELAREQFDQARGDTRSPGYVPLLGETPAPAPSEPEPLVEPSWAAPGSGSTSQGSDPAPAPLEPDAGELVATSTQPLAPETLPELLARAEEPAATESVPELIASEPVQEPAAVSVEPGQGTAAPRRPWLTAAMQRSLPAPDPALQAPPPPPQLQVGSQPGSTTGGTLALLGPQPAPGQPEPTQIQPTQAQPGATSAVASLLEGREPRPSAAVAEPGETGVESEAPSLRQADSTDMATIWEGSAIPQDKLGAPVKILTPNIGRVRVVLKSGDIFEGRMYAVGEGSAWIDTKYGRMALAGERIASMANLDNKDGTPVLGSTGSQELAGMERVRIKTPGGVLYGKIVAQDDKRTTVMTDEGARLTLDNAQVELLVDAPKVVIKGTVPENERPPKKP